MTSCLVKSLLFKVMEPFIENSLWLSMLYLRASTFRSVVFPPPLGPIIATSSPYLTYPQLFVNIYWSFLIISSSEIHLDSVLKTPSVLWASTLKLMSFHYRANLPLWLLAIPCYFSFSTGPRDTSSTSSILVDWVLFAFLFLELLALPAFWFFCLSAMSTYSDYWCRF